MPVVSVHVPSKAARDRAYVRKKGLLGFMELAWEQVEPTFKLSLNWHHELICAGLEALLRGEPEAEKVVVNVPPGSTKSLLMSVFFPAYAWGPGNRPDWRQGYGSFDGTLSLRDSNKCKDLMNSQWYQERWGFSANAGELKAEGHVPVCVGDDDSSLTDSASVWYTSGKGLRFATSTGSKATGWHFHAFFVDDPTKPETIKNGGEQARQALAGCKNWWGGTIASRRVNPSYFGRWVVMQRLHSEDLAGQCLKDKYTAIVVPARHEVDRACQTPWGCDPRTEAGELFWPDRFPEAALKDLEAALGPAHASAQYQQNPIPDGGQIFLTKYFAPDRRYRLLPAGIESWWQSWDCTFSGKAGSDWVVGQVWARKQANYYLVYQIRRRMGLPETIQCMLATQAKYPKAVRKLVENKANGPAVAQVLEGKVAGLVLVEPEGGKVSRAWEAAVYFEGGNVWFPEDEDADWMPEYVAEFLAFPQGKADDQVDSTTQALNFAHPGAGDRLSRMAEAMRKHGIAGMSRS